MSDLLIIGMSFGAIVGILHATHFATTRTTGKGSFAKTIWHAAWIFGLWTLFGFYVFALWLVGAVLLGLVRVAAKLRASGLGVRSGARP